MITHQEILNRVDELSNEINLHYKDKDLALICVLNGSLMVFNELIKRLTVNYEIDYIELSSYKGGTLKAPVTQKNPKGKAKSRRASFCARMCGMKKRLTSAKTANDPNSRINKSLRKWNCSFEPENGEVLSETMLATIKRKVQVLGGGSNKKPEKSKSDYVGKKDAGAIAKKVLQQKQHNKYVNFLPMDEAKKKCGEGEYYCNDDKKCKPIPKGYKIGYGGYLKPENKEDESNGKKGGSNGNGNGHGGNGNGHGGNGNGGNGGGNGGGE